MIEPCIEVSFTLPPVYVHEEPQQVNVTCHSKADAIATVSLAFDTMEVFYDAIRVLNKNEERTQKDS
jgi:hypothetical protein